ncbi:MAG: formate acetyltransferase, partial [Clostridia bacterium]|nr:formate acetyltransferase [Clostridia bacterium]
MIFETAWRDFLPGNWNENIDVRDFIQKNYAPYEGDGDFLAPATERTKKLFEKLSALFQLERQFDGVLGIDTSTVSSLTHYEPGYLDRNNEIIVGLQTSRPLVRGVNPFGGIRMARQACEAYGYKLSERIEDEFTYRTTHNDGVFRAYSDEMRAARSAKLITGLTDAYGRGRIIGDYRRIALYGIDYLIK